MRAAVVTCATGFLGIGTFIAHNIYGSAVSDLVFDRMLYAGDPAGTFGQYDTGSAAAAVDHDRAWWIFFLTALLVTAVWAAVEWFVAAQHAPGSAAARQPRTELQEPRVSRSLFLAALAAGPGLIARSTSVRRSAREAAAAHPDPESFAVLGQVERLCGATEKFHANLRSGAVAEEDSHAIVLALSEANRHAVEARNAASVLAGGDDSASIAALVTELTAMLEALQQGIEAKLRAGPVVRSPHGMRRHPVLLGVAAVLGSAALTVSLSSIDSAGSHAAAPADSADPVSPADLTDTPGAEPIAAPSTSPASTPMPSGTSSVAATVSDPAPADSSPNAGPTVSDEASFDCEPVKDLPDPWGCLVDVSNTTAAVHLYLVTARCQDATGDDCGTYHFRITVPAGQAGISSLQPISYSGDSEPSLTATAVTVQ
ncbi:hypothetical protein [Streptomyces mirabilis]|uniref:hypothetical protein n=1 Tax=Streptomyces mirabilis TaxID=68239 RepID=UPI002259E833|nr:hypothetical protein [Streptomyces mirabilis]MCX4428331.1 hypothetical protein [Streptomyces mirabilis]